MIYGSISRNLGALTLKQTVLQCDCFFLVFGLDAPLGLFPPSLDSCRNPLFDIGEHRNAIDSPMFVKKKSKFQHFGNK